MKTKIFFLLAVILALVLVSSVPSTAIAKGAVVPFKAFYHGVPHGTFDPTCICMHQIFEFTGNATHLGNSRFSVTATAYTPGQTLTQNGSGELIAANGDHLDWIFEGTGNFLPDNLVEFSGTWKVTGGSGRLAGVTGEGTYSGMAGLAPGPVWGKIWLEGQLDK